MTKNVTFVMYLCAQLGFLIGVLLMSILQMGEKR